MGKAYIYAASSIVNSSATIASLYGKQGAVLTLY